MLRCHVLILTPGSLQVGLKDDGSGAVYHYDPVGSMEELTFSAGGAATPLIQPLLDNQVGKANRTDKGDGELPLAMMHDFVLG